MEEVLSQNRGTIFENRVFQFIIRFLTALSFALFTSYQVFLLFTTETAKIGRFMGIICFLIISVASFLTLAENETLLKLCSVLLVIGLFLLFAVKLINIPGLFGMLSFSNPTSVMNCAVFILSEAGAVILAAYYLTLRNDRDTAAKQRTVVILLSAVIALYVACLILECVMLIKYRVNIDLSLKLTLLSRVAYCCGFVGTAVGFLLPAPVAEDDQYKEKQGDFVYSETAEDEIDLIM